MAVIDWNRPTETAEFVNRVYDRYVIIEEAFRLRRVIDARLDVNEGAFLETRALVGSALIEYLASAYAREYGAEADQSASAPVKIRQMATNLHTGFDEQGIRALVQTRNCLAHSLRFATKDEIREHFVLSSFLDITLLRLLGYSGPYIDCRTWQRKILESIG